MPVQPDTRRFALMSDLPAYTPLTQRGVANGVATLDATGRVPTAQLGVIPGVPQTASKPADTSRASTTTLTLDPDLAVTVAATGTYLVQLHAAASSAGTGGLRIILGGTAAFTVPNTSVFYKDTAISAAPSAQLGPGGSFVAYSSAGSFDGPFGLLGTVVVVTAVGTLGLSWAQGASNATGTIVKARSSLIVSRVA